MPAFSQRPQRPAADTSSAAGAFVERHQVGLWRFLRGAGCPAALAEELVQDALLVALRRGIVERPAPAAAAFLRGTAKNLWLRRVRDDRRRVARLLELAEERWRRDAERDLDAQGDARREALDGCLRALPARSRAALRRVYAEGASRRELAAELALTEHGARTLLQRVRKALRACIERRMT